MLEFVPIKHGGGVIVDSKPQQKFEKPDEFSDWNKLLRIIENKYER